MDTPVDIVAPATELKPKTRLTGKVVKTTLAGAVVDIGQNVPGILHISQIQNDPVKKVDELLQVGQSIDVWVRRTKADRIELTMIEPLGLDWKELKPEMTVKGKVVRLETYGAFVEIGAERPGLVHISEMAHGYVKTPQEVVKEGDEIDVMVLDVDRKKKQIRLSIKATLPKPEEKEEVIELPKPERKRPARKGEPRSEGKGEGRSESRGEGRGRGRGKDRTEKFEMPAEPAEVEPTAFELAWKAALDRQKAEKAEKAKKIRDSKQQEDILDRTLKNRLPIG
jgi:small subunit ribosomal protein S1